MSLEADPATESDRAEAEAAGLVEVRRLVQLRVPLPLTGFDDVDDSTRRFRPGMDDEAFLAVNNRAFHWHPEQSDWSAADLAARTAEPWFDPDGFRLLDLDGRLAGFCWTKVHPPTDTDPRLGEIFVIAVDPDFHGRGLGRRLTVAGLAHLASKGIDAGMLFVEHDNEPAMALYTDLGFREHHSHRWWGLPGSTRPAAR